MFNENNRCWVGRGGVGVLISLHDAYYFLSVGNAPKALVRFVKLRERV